MSKNPRIVLSRKAKLMMKYAVDLHPTREVQGFGKITVDAEGDMWVGDLIIPPQVVTGSSADTDPEMLVKLMLAMSEVGQVLADWPFWWHSHAGMNVFASGTDKGTLECFSKEFGSTAVGLVTNNKHEYYSWYSACAVHPYIGETFQHGDIDVLYEVDPIDKAIMGEVEAFMEKVTVKADAPKTLWSPKNWGGPRTSLNGVFGMWVNGKFIPDSVPGKPVLTKKQRKAAKRGDCICAKALAQRDTYGMHHVHPECPLRMSWDEYVAISDAEENGEPEHGDDWYEFTQAQFEEGSPEAKMSKSEFKKFLDARTEEDDGLSAWAHMMGYGSLAAIG